MAKYEQIADALRQSIRAGQLTPGERLPAEDKLAARYRTSVPTLQRALSELVAEGLIDRRHGVGTFVRTPRRRVMRSNDRHQWEKDRVRRSTAERLRTGSTEHDTGLEVTDLAFHAEYRDAKADQDLASVFGVPMGTRLLERIYRTNCREEDAPFALVHSYLVHDEVAVNPDLLDAANEPWPGGTQNQLYTIGIELDRIEERITARPPTVEEAEALGLKKGVSVIVLRKICTDIRDRVVEVSDVTLCGDRTELVFTTPLKRW
ncbi:GntR family transcriptional regulator [Streptomyces antimycoticus]|uniref:Transcriptional regulator n=1 Tax=Streptomyces antimycoticus TaxID=68175 RepID=A0A4D4KAN5_9ACTN|nr:GntR family transcriptional regulator [Streptomyces antimycoticus]GDY43668.1 transcriptional regulator [Streptomyces antimycoticus]